MEIRYTLDEINLVAEKLVEASIYRTLLFYGEMGAGKTTLIKALVEALGSQDTISSPTFSLVNIYDTPKGAVNHFDFYRIEDETEAMDIGIEEYLDSGDWNLVEWPQNIENLLNDNHHLVDISTVGTDQRLLKFS